MKASSEFNRIENHNTEQKNNLHNTFQNNFADSKNKIEQQISNQEINEKTDETKLKQTTENAKEKSKAISKILTAFVAVVSATVIGVTNIEGLLPSSTTLTAYFEELEATQNEINYSVWIEDSRLKNEQDFSGREEDFEVDLSNIYVVLSNKFTNRSEKIEEQWWSGSFENLKENMEYTISVIVGDTIIVTETIKTTNYQQTSSDDPTNNGG